MNHEIKLFFSNVFGLNEKTINDYGAFNISLVNDLPLFIDPILLFKSEKEEYQKSHKEIVKYLRFLKKISLSTKNINKDMKDKYFIFSEVKQNWFGYSKKGNGGRGLKNKFAKSLYEAFRDALINFGDEEFTATYPEKISLFSDGVGSDKISDFATNLIKPFLLKYTQDFAQKYLSDNKKKLIAIDKVYFNYDTEEWENGEYILPVYKDDYVILTPIDILKKDETWISRKEMIDSIEQILDAEPNWILRQEVNEFYSSFLSKKPSKKEKAEAAKKTIARYPQLIDRYLATKEHSGEDVAAISKEDVEAVTNLYHFQLESFVEMLASKTSFFKLSTSDEKNILKGLKYIKKAIEEHDGYQMFYVNDRPLDKEHDLQVMYRIIFFSERRNDYNKGDDKILKGGDCTKALDIVKFKLASNRQLLKYFTSYVKDCKKSDKKREQIHVIMYYSKNEYDKIIKILNQLQLNNNKKILLINASGNKELDS